MSTLTNFNQQTNSIGQSKLLNYTVNGLESFLKIYFTSDTGPATLNIDRYDPITDSIISLQRNNTVDPELNLFMNAFIYTDVSVSTDQLLVIFFGYFPPNNPPILRSITYTIDNNNNLSTYTNLKEYNFSLFTSGGSAIDSSNIEDIIIQQENNTINLACVYADDTQVNSLQTFFKLLLKIDFRDHLDQNNTIHTIENFINSQNTSLPIFGGSGLSENARLFTDDELLIISIDDPSTSGSNIYIYNDITMSVGQIFIDSYRTLQSIQFINKITNPDLSTTHTYIALTKFARTPPSGEENHNIIIFFINYQQSQFVASASRFSNLIDSFPDLNSTTSTSTLNFASVEDNRDTRFIKDLISYTNSNTFNESRQIVVLPQNTLSTNNADQFGIFELIFDINTSFNFPFTENPGLKDTLLRINLPTGEQSFISSDIAALNFRSQNQFLISSDNFKPFDINDPNSVTTIDSYTGTLACILKNSNILTKNGYKLIQDLTNNDILITGDNRETKIISIKKSITSDITNIAKISSGMYGNYEDVYVSKGHAIFDTKENKFIRPMDMNNLPEYKSDDKVLEYYHIELNDKELDTLIVSGMITEGYYTNYNNDNLHIENRNVNKDFLNQFTS
jgi:hypothetical protein